MKRRKRQKRVWLVFSDLDGTLLDEDTYSFEEAKEALSFLKKKDIPIILCSSKTRAEIEIYRKRMRLSEYPFISENGGAIFIPEGEGYRIIELGKPHSLILEVLNQARGSLGISIRGFSDMTPREISEISGLPEEEAILAKKREYSEPILLFESDVEPLELFLRERGFSLTKGGRFFTVIGGNDKGKAVKRLLELYRLRFPDAEILSLGLGDGKNDLPMLAEVDFPVIVRKKTGKFLRGSFNNAYITRYPGPRGWAEAVFKILEVDRG